MENIIDYTSGELIREERLLILPKLEIVDALEIGELAKSKGSERYLPIAIEVRIDNWIIYHASLPGSTSENQWWIDRKARVVLLKHHSTLYERVSAQERGVDWNK
jgi:uncharacterized protein (UPF0303 family)